MQSLASVIIERPGEDLNGEAQAALSVSNAFVIDSAEMAEYAAAQYGTLGERIKYLEDWRVRMKEPILKAGREVDAFMKPPIETMTAARAKLSDALRGWNMRQRAIEEKAQREADQVRKAAEAKAKEEAEAGRRAAAEAAEVERKRIAAEADERRKQIQDEAARIAEEAQRAGDLDAEIAAKARAAEELAASERERVRQEASARAERQRAEAEAEDRRRQAELLADLEAANATAALAPSAVAGLTFRDSWEAEVVDEIELLRGIVDGNTPISVISINRGELNKIARALGNKFSIRGAKAKPKVTTAKRSTK